MGPIHQNTSASTPVVITIASHDIGNLQREKPRQHSEYPSFGGLSNRSSIGCQDIVQIRAIISSGAG